MSPLLLVLFLGLLQGLTEFLPVSSSGHLVLAQSLIPGFSQPGVLLEVALHLGTLGAVCLSFRRDLFTLFVSFFSTSEPEAAPARRFLLFLIIGSVPTAAIGLLFREQFERLFTNVRGVGLCLLVTGILLFLTDRASRQERTLPQMRMRDAFLIGIAQGLAILPGLSRSGTTIAAGALLGLERELLVRYSFLLSIPAIVGAFVLQIVTHWNEMLHGFHLIPYSAGALAALATGYWSIAVLLNMVRTRRLSVFSYYCWTIGGLALFFSAGC